jgi:hypothetical protein
MKFKAREELELVMYSFSPNDFLRKVFVTTKHLKSKCEVGIEAAKNVQLLAKVEM